MSSFPAMDGRLNSAELHSVPPPASVGRALTPREFARAKSPRGRMLGIVSGGSCLLVLLVLYSAFVGRFFYGVSSGPFLMSTSFGLPAATVEAGVWPAYDHPVCGWDGQFYYHQSNDPFLLGDGAKYLDNPSYRYQRNLIPVVAYVTSRLGGWSVTPPAWYQFVQLAFTALGFGALAQLLREFRVSPWWSFVWLLSGGLIWSLFRGLPDAPADALFILSLAALHRGGLGLYVPATSLLLLCREGYAAFAAAVFGLTCCGSVPWRTTLPRWLQAGLTALPGVIVLAWAAYVAQRLDLPLLAGSKSVPWGGLVDWPLFSAVRYLKTASESQASFELVYKSVTLFTLVVVFAYTLRNRNRSPIYAASLPYQLLVMMTGDIIWADASGYLKACSAVLVIGMLLLRESPRPLLYAALTASLLVGVHCNYKKNYRHVGGNLTPVAVLPEEVREPRIHRPPPTPQEELGELHGAVRATALPSQQVATASLLSLRPRPFLLYEVTVENLGDVIWRQSAPGVNRVCLRIVLTNSAGETVFEGRRFLRQDVAPGESLRMTASLPAPRKPGDYRVRLHMIEEGREVTAVEAGDYLHSIHLP